jgi:hypothetical protein
MRPPIPLSRPFRARCLLMPLPPQGVAPGFHVSAPSGRYRWAPASEFVVYATQSFGALTRSVSEDSASDRLADASGWYQVCATQSLSALTASLFRLVPVSAPRRLGVASVRDAGRCRTDPPRDWLAQDAPARLRTVVHPFPHVGSYPLPHPCRDRLCLDGPGRMRGEMNRRASPFPSPRGEQTEAGELHGEPEDQHREKGHRQQGQRVPL